MALQPLPGLSTKEDFLATGLEPMEHEDCSICHSPMDSPVRVRCDGKHVFCREFIVEWFNQPGIDSCPMCRQRLFSVPVAEVAPQISRHEASLLRDAQVNDVFRASGLGHLRLTYQLRNAPVNFFTFHDDIRWSQEQMYISAPTAHMFLASNLRAMPVGAHTVDAKTLGSALILMGNLLMGNATAEHRAWSDANRDTWGEIVMDIWQSIAPYDGLRMYTETLYRNVVASLLDKYCFGAAHPSPFFGEGPLLHDLRFLVLFAVSRSGEWMEWKSLINRPRAQHINVPLVFPCTASRPASLRAAQWMAEVYVHR